MPPGIVQRTLAGARRLGHRTVLAVIVYSFRKAWLDTAERLRRPWFRRPVSPGGLRGVEVSGDTACFTFERADLEVRFLADDLVRLTWTPGELPVPYAQDRTDWAGPTIAGDEPGSGRWTAGELSLDVGNHGAVTIRTLDGALVRAEEPPRRRGGDWSGRARLPADDRVHGLGERATPFDLRPGRYGLWNAEQDGSYQPGNDPLYLTAPVYLTVGPAGSHLAFHENSHWGEFELDDAGISWHFDGGAARTYVVPGPPGRALARYTELTGRTPLPPDWAFGYHHSRWGYRTQAEVEAVVEGFDRHELPLSAVHLDIDHMDRYRVFTVDRERFPDLRGLGGRLATRDRHLVAIVDPGVAADGDFALYEDGRREGRFARLGGRVFRGPAWPGWVAYPDFTDPGARRWWGEQYHRLLEDGITGFWHDMNEPAAFAIGTQSSVPAQVRHAMEGRGGRHQEAHNLYALEMARAAREALEAARPHERPFLFSRSGWAGIQRFAWTWTGDAETSWEMLRRTVAVLLNLGLSGLPYTGSDIGGFSGGPGPELYVRWFELGAFCPLFRTHCAFDSPPREPWEVAPDHLDELRELLRLRYRLVPHLQSVAADHVETGAPLMRPLWWPDGDPELLDVDDAFLLGDSLLVAPVLDEGARSREVRLPDGRWIEWWTGSEVAGGSTITFDAPLGRPVLLARPGSPLLDQARRT